ncbi:hypothetical protein VQ056_16675 [Paenibacillus sp. JTLBN-2024]
MLPASAEEKGSGENAGWKNDVVLQEKAAPFYMEVLMSVIIDNDSQSYAWINNIEAQDCCQYIFFG